MSEKSVGQEAALVLESRGLLMGLPAREMPKLRDSVAAIIDAAVAESGQDCEQWKKHARDYKEMVMLREWRAERAEKELAEIKAKAAELWPSAAMSDIDCGMRLILRELGLAPEEEKR